MHFLMLPVSVSPNLLTLIVGLGRRGELHPSAPVAAAPAPLRARGYSSLTNLADS